MARAALVCGFIGGIGFAAASMLKLVEVTSGYQTNWHSILEQTTGLFNGIGLAVAVAAPGAVEPAASSDAGDRAAPATEPFALGFVLLGITYLNLRKNVGQWVKFKTDAGRRWRASPRVPGSTWDTSCLALTLLVLLPAPQAPLPIVPASRLGRGNALSRVALVAGRRQLRARPGRLHGRAAGDRGRDLCRRPGLYAPAALGAARA